uniref:RxLR effector protein n=1 Tax=Chromera velia CCMP2878 TaxID=1169474 RepID=A0A0G4GUY9_9ALVE|eukprot:Cvel_23476.t1-p1 / transcript=Cvel_23476.t1 / gene=Cvel_23476 / organism=Chromera_velia_CCMP2878 / gene_product=hypothetical protein / transcript_product=hypothetical protein / location=Cvel_scaffold2423:25283-26321(+) / protein_length=161 / sequence_SO=supercontig / SO=protein_coding / is_pseudo=false
MMQFLAALFVCFVVCVHPARLLSSFVPNFRCREVGIRSIAGDGKKNRVLNSVRLKLLDQKEKAETEECKSESDGKQKGTVGTEKEEAKDEPLWKRTVRAWKVYQDGRKQNARLLYEKLSGNSITEEIEDREVQKLTARFMADNMQNKTATDLYFKLVSELT